MKKTFLLIFLLVLLTACSTKPTETQPTSTTVPPTTAPLLNGWQEQDGHQYYYENGIPHTGWLELDGKRHYFRDDGTLHTGWLETDEGRYFLLSDGPATSWQKINGSDHYFHPDGLLATGWTQIDDKQVYLDQDGMLTTGWLDLEGARYHFLPDGTAAIGWTQIGDATHYFNADGTLATGWIEEDGHRYYLDENGTPTTGWLDLDSSRYYLGDQGTMHTGWLYTAEASYYFRPDGTMARGKVETPDRGTRYFTSTGKEVIMVNPWNPVPQDYSPTIVSYGSWQIDAACRDALKQMIADCAEAGHTAVVVSAYRSYEYQSGLFQRRIQRFMDEGYDRDEAERLAAMRVARPGTSEHQLGLALDIVDVNYQNLNEKQETMPAQIWLMENSWRYGFILRYPNEASNDTGIIYEPWHYRYVGTELAAELHATGQCLEVYLASLTDP